VRPFLVPLVLAGTQIRDGSALLLDSLFLVAGGYRPAGVGPRGQIAGPGSCGRPDVPLAPRPGPLAAGLARRPLTQPTTLQDEGR
jgi:hypothetical protein